MSKEDIVGDSVEEQEEEQSQADLDALQAEVVDLRRQVAEAEAVKSEDRHNWRRFAVAMLILLGSLVVIGANLAFWMRGTILNTDRWVSTVGPLSRNEVIVNTLTGAVVADLFEVIDVEQVARDVLPEEVAFLSGPLTGAVQDAVGEVISKVIRSDQFNAVWVAVNRAAHQVVIGVLHGGGDVLYVKGGQLTVDLSDLFGSIESLVGLEDLDLFAGEDVGKFVLLESGQVAVLQQALTTLDAVGLLLPILALVLYFLAWLVSLWRRKTLLWIGAALAITMTLVLILLAMAQPVVLASMADPVLRALAGEIWDVVLRGLVIQTILLGILGLLVALGAALAGPHPRAVAIRTGVRERIGRLAQ
jgi:hypothetical protein